MYKNLIVCILAFLTFSCGGWVKNYDLEPNKKFRVSASAVHRSDIFITTQDLANRYDLKIIIKDDFAGLKGAFQIAMFNQNVRVYISNINKEKTFIAFYKAVDPEKRPTDIELEKIVADFRQEFLKIDGVNLISTQ